MTKSIEEGGNLSAMSKEPGINKLNSAKLFNSAKEVMIEHNGETYILRLTKQNKLILTK